MIPGYLMHEMQRYESLASSAKVGVSGARTIMDLVRAVNNRPRANTYLRCLANVKGADSRLMLLAERRADELVTKRLEFLQGILGSEDFCVEAGKLRQELRYLLPAVGRVAQAAERSLLAMERSMESQSPVVRERVGG